MNTTRAGFTLMEMIGVVAVIAVLASLATPMIFDAIRNARATAIAVELRTIRTGFMRFYADTGQFPDHQTRQGNVLSTELLNNPSPPIPGWDGPYIDGPIEIGISQSRTFGILPGTTSGFNQFDFDGDGTIDTSQVSIFEFECPDTRMARRISNILDGDGDITTGDDAWLNAGTFRLQSRTPADCIYFLGEL